MNPNNLSRRKIYESRISEPENIPLVTVIIVNYNAAEWLSTCVDSVLRQTIKNFECIIVDNGSVDGSLETLPELDDRFTIIEAGENLGFAAGNNRAAQKARAPWLALLNPDAFAKTDWLEKGLAAKETSPRITMVGSTQYLALEPGQFDGLGDFYHISGLAWRAGFCHPVHDIQTREAFGPCGAAAFYKTEDFLKLGGFDERFFCYHEDVDMAYRMRLAGGICIQSAEAKVDHVSSGVSGRASDFAVFHGTRNRIWTFVKNTPGRFFYFLLPVHILMNLTMLLWAAFRTGRFGATYRGIRAAMKGIKPILKDRKKVQALRAAPVHQIMRTMTWSPRVVVKRSVPDIQGDIFSAKRHP